MFSSNYLLVFVNFYYYYAFAFYHYFKGFQGSFILYHEILIWRTSIFVSVFFITRELGRREKAEELLRERAQLSSLVAEISVAIGIIRRYQKTG